MEALLLLPGKLVTLLTTLAGVWALLAHANDNDKEPPSVPGAMYPLSALLARADQAHRRGTPYAAMAARRVMQEVKSDGRPHPRP